MSNSDLQPAGNLPPDPPDEYIIESLPDPDHEGWFPLGEVSLIAGSSGTGKTTWLLQVLEQVRQGLTIFGHRTNKGLYCILLHDRSKKSFRRTLRRMKLPEDIQNCVYRLTSEQQKDKNPHEIVEGVIQKNQAKYRVIVIEGLDMWQPSAKATADLVSAAAFIDDLQRVAEKYNISILGTVGSPKQKPKDRYEMQRDSVFGSSALGRKVETIVFLQLADLKDPNSAREVFVLTRQGKAEKFKFRFSLGRLVDDSELPLPPPLPQHSTKFDQWLETRKVGQVLKWSVDSGMNESTFYRGVQAAHKKGLVFKQDGQWYKTLKAECK